MHVDILLDTGVLGINGNYISLDIVNQIQLEYNFKPPVTNNESVCSGLDGICTKKLKSVTLNVHSTCTVIYFILFYHQQCLI